MKLITASLLTLALVLSGCTSDEPDPESDDLQAPPTDSTGGTGNTGGSTPPPEEEPSNNTGATPPPQANGTAPNTPPEAELVATTTQVIVPADVTFTLSGSDADGDDLAWTLDADGDGVADSEGTSLPFNFTFSYTAAGNYTVTFNVTDGSINVVETLVVDAIEEVAPAADFPFSADIPLTIACFHCFVVGGGTADGCLSFQTGRNGVDCGWVELPAGAGGRDFTADGDGDADVVFYDTCGGEAVGIYDNEGNEAGTVPSGSGCVVAWDFSSDGSTIKIVIT